MSMGILNWIMFGSILLVFSWESTNCQKRSEVERNFSDEEEIPLNDWTSYDLDGPNNWPNFSWGRTKRAAFGILRLATKRPHKTAAQLTHLPPQDTFLSVRGRKRSYQYSYPLMDSFRDFSETPISRILANLKRFQQLHRSDDEQRSE